MYTLKKTKKKPYIGLIYIYKLPLNLQNFKYLLRNSLKKFKVIVTLGKFQISKKILNIFQKRNKCLVGTNKTYICIFIFSNVNYFLRYAL